MLRDMGIEHVYDSRSTDFADADPARHRRLRRRRRAELAARRGAAGRPGTADLRRPVRRDRQARHLRRHQDGPVPVPPQPVLLRRRPGAADADRPRHPARPARGRSTSRSPTACCRRRRPRTTRWPTAPPPSARWVPPSTPASWCSTFRARGQYRRRGARRAGARVPCRRRLRRHRRSRWSRSVPGREDGRGRLRPHRPQRPVRADAGGACASSSGSAQSGTEVEVELGDIAEPETADRLVAAATATGTAAARCAARRGRHRGRHAGQHHRRTDRPGLGAEGVWARGTCTRPPRRSRWTGSARSPRRPRWSARPGRVPTRRPTAGWTRSRTGVAPRACRPASIAWGAWAEIGAGQAMADNDGMAIDPEDGAYAFDTLMRHNRVYSGYAPVAGARLADRVRADQPVRRGVRARSAQDRSGSSEFLDGAAPAAAGGVAGPGAAADLRADQPDPAPVGRRRTVRCRSTVWIRSARWKLRTRLESETGVRIGSTDITTVRALAERLCEMIAGDLDSTAVPVSVMTIGSAPMTSLSRSQRRRGGDE